METAKPLINAKRNAYAETHRKCRDMICTIIILVCWVAMVVIALVGQKYGNPERLIYPTDHAGNLCTPPKPNLFYPHPQEDVAGSGQSDPSKVHFFGVCVERCPHEGEDAGGYIAPITTASIFNRCLPSQKDDIPKEYEYIFGSTTGFLNYAGRYVSDIRTAYVPVLISGGVIPFFLAMTWVMMLRSCPSFVVWLSIFLAFASLLFATVVAGYNAKLIKNHELNKYASEFSIKTDEADLKTMKIATGVLIFLDVALLLTVLFLYSRINLAIGILRESAKSIQKIPSLLLFPFVPALFLIMLLGYFVVSSAYVGSSDTLTFQNIKETTGTESIAYDEPSNIMWYLFAFNTFGVLWTQQLIEAIMICTVSGAVCKYYWNDKVNGLGWAVGDSLYTSIRYHFGSLAFGSCILAMVQFFRIVLEFIERRTRNSGNKVVKVILSCLRVCMWCMHKCLKFLSKSGYIMIAMKGGSFCSSITESFQLLAANSVRIATVSAISAYVLFLGKLFITASCSCGLYYYLQVHAAAKFPELTSYMAPVVVAGVMAFGMSYFYLAVFDIAVDTILLSVCEDEKINKMTGSYYANSSIRQYLDNSEAKAFKGHRDTAPSSSYGGI